MATAACYLSRSSQERGRARCVSAMLAKSRKADNGVITLHKPVPPHQLHHAAEQFRLERWDADAIVKPLLDTEHGFIKDLEHFLNHRDSVRVRNRELLHKRWTECVWWPVQQSVEQRYTRSCHKRAEPRKLDYTDYSTNVSTASLKDPLFLYARSRMEEKRAALRCLTGCLDGCLWVESAEEQSRNTRVSRSQGPVYMATADGRCFRPGCWSAIGLSRDYPVKS